MKESRKFYNRGVKNFHKGDLEKAIANLDVAISYDMKNSDALNLRGMIYYLKGQGQKAITSWKINIDFNKDEIAKGYIEAYINEDKINEYRYKQALKMIEELKIKSAIESLEAASGSDYNIINVRNTLAYCYIKERSYQFAKNQIEMVLDKDRDNAVAKGNLETIKRETSVFILSKQKVMMVLSVIIVLIGGVTAMRNKDFSNKNLVTIPREEIIKEEAEIEVEKETKEKDEVVKGKIVKEEVEKKNDIVKMVGIKELENAIEGLDFKWIDENLEEIEKQELSKEDAKVLDRARSFMATEGVEELYSRGKSNIKEKKFESGEENLLMAKKYSKESYLDQHITYMIAGLYEELEDIKNTNLYYEEYISEEYDDEKTYEEEVLYKLATLNKDSDKVKSKKYARKLVNSFDDSMYNNIIIKEILE